jgi:hypothetical protein
MTSGVRGLEEERLRLVARCDSLRGEIGRALQPFASRVALADQLVGAVRRLTRSLGPLLLVYSFLKRR